MDTKRIWFNAQVTCGCLSFTPEREMSISLRMHKGADAHHSGCQLFKHLDPFSAHRRFEIGEAGNISARMRQTIYKPTANWIGYHHKDNRRILGEWPQLC